ncbi:MAG TPA: hypothetical protein VKV73_26295 [Chloroflexota bacterium]|nr:hypothetical protein [Chloroflexota bacterium]
MRLVQNATIGNRVDFGTLLRQLFGGSEPLDFVSPEPIQPNDDDSYAPMLTV